MFLFYRKKLVIVVSIVSIFFLLILYFTDNKSEAVSTPVSNHVVVLDAGHGIPDRWGRGK